VRKHMSPQPIYSMLQTLFRVAAWLCLAAITVLTVVPINHRPSTAIPADVERFLAYAVLAFLFSIGYPRRRMMVVIFVIAVAGLRRQSIGRKELAAVIAAYWLARPGADPYWDFSPLAVAAIVAKRPTNTKIWPSVRTASKPTAIERAASAPAATKPSVDVR